MATLNVFQAGLFDLFGSEEAARAKVTAAVEAGEFRHSWIVNATEPSHAFDITNLAPNGDLVLWRGDRAYSGSIGDVIIAGDHERGWLVMPIGFADLDRAFVRWFETKVTQCMLMGKL
jgi:hypothetical protein